MQIFTHVSKCKQRCREVEFLQFNARTSSQALGMKIMIAFSPALVKQLAGGQRCFVRGFFGRGRMEGGGGRLPPHTDAKSVRDFADCDCPQLTIHTKHLYLLQVVNNRRSSALQIVNHYSGYWSLSIGFVYGYNFSGPCRVPSSSRTTRYKIQKHRDNTTIYIKCIQTLCRATNKHHIG